MAPLMVAHEPVPVQPPATLSEAARKVFLDLVSSVDPAHFELHSYTSAHSAKIGSFG
jgi:hypothetical protein